MRKVREQKECLQALKEACYITITIGQHENPDEQWKSVSLREIKFLSEKHRFCKGNAYRFCDRNNMVDF